ncbi:MAG: nitroreductase family protein [Rhodobiaceae bacterium]|nr:nitroreductase family protein [Rhodobiaceae bacterium]
MDRTEHKSSLEAVSEALEARFGDAPAADVPAETADALVHLARHGCHRVFDDRPVDQDLVRLVCACALSAPTKSDLQQRDIIIVSDPALRGRIDDLLDTGWIRKAPVMLVVCANGRRLPQIAQWRGKPFPNDHFDLLFNAVGDAAISLGWLQVAVNMAGLGGCPVSIIRDHAAEISRLLALPEKVIPFAGFCLGWPKKEAALSPRLPLSVTVHENTFSDDGLEDAVADYDRRRASVQPYHTQRDVAQFGEVVDYGWSEDKARQYAEPMRTDFGRYVRDAGFSFD